MKEMTPRERAKMLLQISSAQEMWPEHWQRFFDQIEADTAAAEAASRADERKKAIDAALAILHEEGWIGRTEQRICAIAYPLPPEGALAQPQPSGEGGQP